MVAARYCHNRAGAVISNNVVSNPNGNLVAIYRVDNITPRKGAVLFAIALSALYCTYFFGCLNQRLNVAFIFATSNQILKTRIFRCQQEEATTKQRVWARGEYRDRVFCGGVFWCVAVLVTQNEIDFSADRSANPISLHLLYRLRPTLKLIKIVQKLLGIVGNLEIPLGQIALFHSAMATPAFTFGNLFVSQNRLTIRAPIHRRVATLD